MVPIPENGFIVCRNTDPSSYLENLSSVDDMNGSDVHQRAIESILDGAREERRFAEKTVHAILALFTDLAFRIDGERMKVLQEREPDAPRGWTKAEWKQFFEPVRFYSFGWPRPELDLPTEQEEKMIEEIREMREQISQLKAQLGERDEEEFTGIHLGHTRGLIIPSHTTYPKPIVPRAYEDFIEPLRHMNLTKKPRRFQNVLGESESMYRRQLMVLYILATKGVNVRIEIDLLIAVVEEIAPRGSTVRKIVDKLKKGGLVESRIFSIERPFHTSINLVWMTDAAKDFCQKMNWKVSKSEWEKLNRCQGELEMGEKNIAIAIVALHARLRGYGVKVLPDSKGEISADLFLTDMEGNDFHVFVFLENWASDEIIGKMKAIQGKVGICTQDPEDKERTIEFCRKNGIGHGFVTDLQSLITGNGLDKRPMSITEITQRTVMWDREW